MRKALSDANIKEAKEMGLGIDESIERVNNRLSSENAWKQKIIIETLVPVFCERIDINLNKLNEEAIFRLSAIIYGLYDGVLQSIEKIKIKK